MNHAAEVWLVLLLALMAGALQLGLGLLVGAGLFAAYGAGPRSV